MDCEEKTCNRGNPLSLHFAQRPDHGNQQQTGIGEAVIDGEKRCRGEDGQVKKTQTRTAANRDQPKGKQGDEDQRGGKLSESPVLQNRKERALQVHHLKMQGIGRAEIVDGARGANMR